MEQTVFHFLVRNKDKKVIILYYMYCTRFSVLFHYDIIPNSIRTRIGSIDYIKHKKYSKMYRLNENNLIP